MAEQGRAPLENRPRAVEIVRDLEFPLEHAGPARAVVAPQGHQSRHRATTLGDQHLVTAGHVFDETGEVRLGLVDIYFAGLHRGLSLV